MSDKDGSDKSEGVKDPKVVNLAHAQKANQAAAQQNTGLGGGVNTAPEPHPAWLRMECLRLAAAISSTSTVIDLAQKMESYVKGETPKSAA